MHNYAQIVKYPGLNWAYVYSFLYLRIGKKSKGCHRHFFLNSKSYEENISRSF